jgi:hypothetical protein
VKVRVLSWAPFPLKSSDYFWDFGITHRNFPPGFPRYCAAPVG